MDELCIRAENLLWKPQSGPFFLGPLIINVHAGKLIALVGPNGSGKSSLIRLIAGILNPSDGSIEVLSRSPTKWSPTERGQRMAYLAQFPDRPFGFTVWDYTALGRFPHLGPFKAMRHADRACVEREINAWNLQNLIRRPVTGLSGGEFQRTRLARALVQNPRLLLLDEPANHLDIGGKAKILSRLKKETANGRTVLTVFHNLNDALMYADEVWLMSEGSIVQIGTPGEVLRPKILEPIYGVKLDLYRSELGGILLGDCLT